MAIEEVASNLGLEASFDAIVTLLQIIGGIFGIYVIFWVINSFINTKRNKTLKSILKNIEEINVKLDKLAKK